MIPEAQVLLIVKEKFPEIPIKETEPMPGNLQQISNYAIWLLTNDDTDAACSLMQLMDDLHKHSCPTVKNGLENILFYNLGTWFSCDTRRRDLMKPLPPAVQHIITQQFISSSI